MNNNSNSNLTALFLQQSLYDSQDDYDRTLNGAAIPHFDAIVITASNEHQAQTFRKQLAARKLPAYTDFIVIPDKNGERVGSGGATLSAIKYLKEKYGTFYGKTFAIIHSGGDSKRTPAYSALGKLFSPVPRVLPSGKPSTLFDEFMISIASVPGRIREGLLVLSGDVMLLYNPLQIDFSGSGAAAISFKENVEIGKSHGVFLGDKNGNVKRFLHKQSVESLTEAGAVNENGNVSIDTGAVIFAPDILDALYSLIKTEDGENKYINSVTRLSLYGDFLYPLAADSTLEAFYNEAPEGEFCDELHDARTVIWNILSPYSMKLLNLAPAKFIHFGTTKEVMHLMNEGWKEYEALGWNNRINSSLSADTAGYNSVLSKGAQIGKGCYLECSYVHHNAKIGKNSLVSFIDIHDEEIPDNVVLHGLKQSNGKFVCRIYGVEDNPKEAKLFGRNLADIDFIGSGQPLWLAELYPECDTVKEAVASALNLYKLVMNEGGNLDKWEKADKKSLCSGFNDADPQAITDWQERMSNLVCMDEIAGLIDRGAPAEKGRGILENSALTKIQREWLENKINNLKINNLEDFSKAIRLYHYIGVATDNDELKKKCFKTISDTILSSTLANLKYNENAKIVSDKTVVKLPLRVNWGGGWTDTPPYCIEHGGKVLNAAISLKGKLPVEVTLVKIPEYKIVFDSRDMDVHGEFTDIDTLQDTGNPYDSFALQKACLLACGIIPKCGGNLKEILTRMGGGFEMHSEVTDVPKGSGLGTSSILAAACVKAVLEFTGAEYTDADLYGHVLVMEQIMSTGGGWQDQVGGVINGVKLITSEPGLNQQINVRKIELTDKTMAELNERFCLIYTGQRRLARNLLRDVVGNYVGNDAESLYAHKEIKNVADKMCSALENDNIDEFAELLNSHWELSKKIDSGTSNTLIEQIFMVIEDLIDGRFVSGAGGGGFLQVILKKNVSKEDVHKRLKSVFQDFPVDVWACEFIN